MDKYQIQKTLGEGAQGSFVKAVDKNTKETVAIKILKTRMFSWDDVISLAEVRSLRKLTHPSIARLKEVIKNQNQVFLVFEFVESNLLRFYRKIGDNGSRMEEEDIKKIIGQVLVAVDWVHSKGVLHRNIRPESILLDKGKKVRVSGFTVARDARSRQPCTEYVSTRWYRAPEMLLHSSAYSTPVDMWAVGCLTAELWLLNPLFQGESEMDQLMKIIEVLGTPTIQEWPDALKLAGQMGISFPKVHKKSLGEVLPMAPPLLISFVSDLIRYDPAKRLTAQQALAHPFIGLVTPSSKKQLRTLASLQIIQPYNLERARAASLKSMEFVTPKSNKHGQNPPNQKEMNEENHQKGEESKGDEKRMFINEFPDKNQQPLSVFRQHFSSSPKQKESFKGPEGKEGETDSKGIGKTRRKSSESLPQISKPFRSGPENISKAYRRPDLMRPSYFSVNTLKLPKINHFEASNQGKRTPFETSSQKNLLINIKDYSP